MPLVATKVSKMSGGGRQLFIYDTPDLNTAVRAAGYFNGITDQLRQFDVIIAVCGTGGTVVVDILTVTSASGAASVTVAAN